MKILLLNSVDPWTRSVATIHSYVAWGRRLGHDIAVYGEANPELPHLRYSSDISDVDLVVFVVQVPSDVPKMPGLARIMDCVPRHKRLVIDLWGRFNDTVRIDHDFNHLEKFDGHPAWEWEEALRALGDTIVQPTLQPRRATVGSFLFHGFDAEMVARPIASAAEAADAWRKAGGGTKPYGLVYVGSNWQRWTQMRALLEDYGRVAGKIGQFCLAGWDWNQRPSWAIELGIQGIDTDPELLADLRVEIRQGIRFDWITDLIGQGRFAPVIHRPLFRELNLVTNRTFETFLADSVPVLMLPEAFVSSIYGPSAVKLVPQGSVASHLEAVMRDPEPYWDAVLKTRGHLAMHHSFEQRFKQLCTIAKSREAAAAAT